MLDAAKALTPQGLEVEAQFPALAATPAIEAAYERAHNEGRQLAPSVAMIQNCSNESLHSTTG